MVQRRLHALVEMAGLGDDVEPRLARDDLAQHPLGLDGVARGVDQAHPGLGRQRHHGEGLRRARSRPGGDGSMGAETAGAHAELGDERGRARVQRGSSEASGRHVDAPPAPWRKAFAAKPFRGRN